MIVSGISPGKNSDPSPALGESERKVAVSAALSTLNDHLTSIWNALPSRTALVLFTGHGDPRAMVDLQKRKAAWEAMVSAKTAASLSTGPSMSSSDPEVRWTTADVRALEDAVELAKRGLLFLAIK